MTTFYTILITKHIIKSYYLYFCWIGLVYYFNYKMIVEIYKMQCDVLIYVYIVERVRQKQVTFVHYLNNSHIFMVTTFKLHAYAIFWDALGCDVYIIIFRDS